MDPWSKLSPLETRSIDARRPLPRVLTGASAIPKRLWENILASIPIACVDLIVHKRVGRETQVLLGYRKIYPYSDCWALPGGRILKNERLRETANRQLFEIGLHPSGNYELVGVYPVNFKRRSDISICLSTHLSARQEPRPTMELVRYAWRALDDLPRRVGSNYRAMLRDFKDKSYSVR